MTGPRIGSLFSGYGGLDMGVRAVLGGHVAWHCEFDVAPSKVLAHHWPDMPNLGDITTADWTQVPPVDVLTGGYPCQPFSTAGKRKGTDDPRHLWPPMLRAIRVLRPRLVVAENVRGHLRLGFDSVLRDLAAIGFDAQWVVVRASAAGAPHRRERLFIAAHPHGEQPVADAGRIAREVPDRRELAVVPQPSGAGPARRTRNFGRYNPAIVRWEATLGRPAPSPTEPGKVGPRLSPAFVEWMMGLPAGHVTDPAIGLTRTQQLKALGSGVVPQHAAMALRMLIETGPTS